MTSKVPIIIIITVVAGCVCALGWHQLVNNNKEMELAIKTIGLPDLNIELQSAYGPKAPQHVLIINKSSHYILACEILYEFIPRVGDSRFSRKIVAYDTLLVEKDAVARKALLQSLGIKPNSKTLIGMGTMTDMVNISDSLPPLTTPAANETLQGQEEYEQLVIRLNAVVLENGKAFGPNAEQFVAHLNTTILQKEKR